ncbi:MAG: HlyC/CorC family transporter, partial [Chloroflexi bacterium]|nr:HlyC/CorC family transporter [Chloroflexota bacterium]
ADSAVTSLSIVKFLALVASILSFAALIIATLGPHWGYVAGMAIILVIFLGLLQLLGRVLVHRYEDVIVSLTLPLSQPLAWAFRPLLLLQNILARFLGGAGQSEIAPEDKTPNRQAQLNRLPLELLERPLDETEIRMIRAVLQMEKATAREIMVPRVDIIAADADSSSSQLADLMIKSGFSRTPLYEGSIDNIVGIVHARDLVQLLNQNDLNINLKSIAKPVLFIPESKRLEELLKEFQQKRVHIAVVVDEYGGVSGLVSIEDLLEEIVGDIEDEFGSGEPEVEIVNDNEAIINARISIDRLNELFSLNLESQGFNTLGGMVYHHLGKVPSLGDELEYSSLRIQVLSTLGRRINRVRVTKILPKTEEELSI